MGWLTGILSGYGDRNREIVADNQQRAEEARAREERIFWALAQHDDPDIADLGATGLLEGMRPQKRKGGFAGWIGEMEGSQTYNALRNFRKNMEVPQSPSVPATGQIPTTPGTANSAALPTTSPTTGTMPTTPQPAPPSFPSERAQRGLGATIFQRPAQARTAEEAADLGAANEPVIFPTPYVGMGGLSTPPPAPSGQPMLDEMMNRELAARGIQPAPQGPVVESVPYASMGANVFGDIAQPGSASAAVARAGMPVTTGPALPTPGPPPSPPGIGYASGLPGGTTSPVGQAAALPPRTSRSRLFPSLADVRASAVRAELQAQIGADTEMYQMLGLPLQEARERAVKLYEQERVRRSAGSLGTPRLVKGEYIDPITKQKVRNVPMLFDPATQTLKLANGQPAPPDAKLSGTSLDLGDPMESAAQAMGYERAEDVPPAQQDELLRRAGVIAGSLGYDRTAGTARAQADRPLSRGELNQSILASRDDWRTASSRVTDALDAVTSMRAAYNEAKRTGNVAAAAEAIQTLFQKTLDRNSVVRETEANRPVQFQGLTTRIQGYFDNLIKGGGKIPFEILDQYVTMGEILTQAISVRLEDERSRIERYLKSIGADPTLVLPPSIGTAPPPPPGGAGAAADVWTTDPKTGQLLLNGKPF